MNRADAKMLTALLLILLAILSALIILYNAT